MSVRLSTLLRYRLEQESSEGLPVYYWPQMDLILVHGFDDIPDLFEAPNCALPKLKRPWLWTLIGDAKKQLVKIGEL